MKFIVIISIVCFCITRNASAQSNGDVSDHPCLKCHSGQSYTFHNELTEKEEKKLMNPYYIIDTAALATGVHNQFDCTDCHSFDYETYPHAAELKLEPLGTCLDCHGGDETFASYQFERIEEESKKSIHYQLHGEDFTCAKCHSQHSYTAKTRNSENVTEIVNYSNEMCLLCHDDIANYQLLTDANKPVLVQSHSWLPNQERHFKSVRCIECHTEIVDSLMVSHNILPKKDAIKSCVECHSGNSRLKASLYKYQNLQSRSKNGSVNTLIANKSYIVGTQQNPILKLISIIIFLATLAGIGIHLIFRIIKK